MSAVLETRGSFHVNGGQPHPGTLTVIRDIHRVATLSPKADERWTFRDAAGHFHAYSTREERYPTLFELDFKCESTHEDGDGWWCECRTEYQCRICNEVITPGMRPGPHEEMHPGLQHWEASLVCYQMCPPLEIGAMVTVEAIFSTGTFFGIAVVTGTRTDSMRTETLLAGAGPLGELKK